VGAGRHYQGMSAAQIKLLFPTTTSSALAWRLIQAKPIKR
jgi:hypothetical protein